MKLKVHCELNRISKTPKICVGSTERSVGWMCMSQPGTLISLPVMGKALLCMWWCMCVSLREKKKIVKEDMLIFYLRNRLTLHFEQTIHGFAVVLKLSFIWHVCSHIPCFGENVAYFVLERHKSFRKKRRDASCSLFLSNTINIHSLSLYNVGAA